MPAREDARVLSNENGADPPDGDGSRREPERRDRAGLASVRSALCAPEDGAPPIPNIPGVTRTLSTSEVAIGCDRLGKVVTAEKCPCLGVPNATHAFVERKRKRLFDF